MPGGTLTLRVMRLALLAAIGWFVMTVARTALFQTFDHEDFSESLTIKVEHLPLLFPVHMFTGALALVLVPAAFLLRRQPRWHRPMGAIAAADVALAGLTAYPVAWIAPISPWSAAGFTAQASVWLALLALGIRNILLGRVAAHRAAMLLMLAVTSGAVFFRVFLALWALLADGRHFVLFYSCNAWAGWLLPLTLTAAWLRRNEARFPRPGT
ncbi:DUF2306 domain-containing protein [Novosphingobium album (ex Liu et al. 2023)]|uniref:DUF2306 domain-containing protein n=1 Tax=Novosphingobium album (ex Liu et al. 2023) TaxID=3031130 RepID=A0ABT5WQT4_9SPHN|nr:DUF2306 domain-containing protein [Novosphingobium album (ex Liu et al. 2023)]MDE8652384.1 DUF2306 domain-containing protein [Novosphingobium album (ex Liu et al. 2023)]